MVSVSIATGHASASTGRMVEQRDRLLPVICGTDTLGVGINVDTYGCAGGISWGGRRQAPAKAREFHQQIAEWAGVQGLSGRLVIACLNMR